MIPCIPDEGTIHTAMSLAARAPSFHDCQPWLWRLANDGLHLYADTDQRGAETDMESRNVLLSCGASLHHCVVALAALGWRAKIRWLPDAAEPEHLAALELNPHPASALDVMLASAIPRQRDDWRQYSSWAVSAADIALIGARAAGVGVTTRRVETLSEVQHVVAQAVSRHAMGSAEATRDERDVTFAESQAAEDYGVVLALGTRDDTRLARLRAGQAMSLALLSATALGLATCLITEPLASAETRDALHDNLFNIVGFPQILLRIGWPPVGADPLPLSGTSADSGRLPVAG